MSDETKFTLDQAMRAQRALRDALGLGPETFPLPAFIGMISDEIQQMREASRTDAEIADIVSQTLGQPMPVEALTRHYAPPEARRWPD